MSTVNSDLESQTAAVSSNAAAAAPAAAASAGEVVAETPELVARKTDELRELLVENANAEHRSDAFLLRFLRWSVRFARVFARNVVANFKLHRFNGIVLKPLRCTGLFLNCLCVLSLSCLLRSAKFDAAKAAKRVQRYEMWTQEHLAHAGQLTALRFLSLLESG